MSKSPDETLKNMKDDLREMPFLSSSMSRPQKVHPLNGQRYRKTNKSLGTAHAAKWKADATVVMRDVFLPLLEKCQNNYAVCVSKKMEPEWAECSRICERDLKIIEAKVK